MMNILLLIIYVREREGGRELTISSWLVPSKHSIFRQVQRELAIWNNFFDEPLSLETYLGDYKSATGSIPKGTQQADGWLGLWKTNNGHIYRKVWLPWRNVGDILWTKMPFVFLDFFFGGGVFMTLKLYINNDLSSRMRNGHDGYLLIKSTKVIAIRINREKALDTKELL